MGRAAVLCYSLSCVLSVLTAYWLRSSDKRFTTSCPITVAATAPTITSAGSPPTRVNTREESPRQQATHAHLNASSGSCRAAARTWDESFVVESVVGRGASGDGGEGGRDEAKQHTDAEGTGVLLHTTGQGGRSVLAPRSEPSCDASPVRRRRSWGSAQRWSRGAPTP